MTLDWTWIAAIAGGIGMFWKQAKTIITSIKSIFVVTFEIPYNRHYFIFYCWDHFEASKLGTRRFGFESFFLRSNRRTGEVGMEYQGKSITFWHGYWPLTLNLELTGDGYASETLIVTYIRGTFDVLDLIHRVAEYRNHMVWGVKSKTHRYKIIRKFGLSTFKDEEDKKQSNKPGYSNVLSSVGRPIGTLKEDLGVPIEKNPFQTLFYGSEVHEFFTKIKKWKESRDWYYDHLIPWRLGGLLKGIPGTGKTSFVRAMAQTLDLPIVIIDLPSVGNRELTEIWGETLSMSPCIILFEDIDRLFNKQKQFNTQDRTFSMRDPVSLDCLLNCISGVEPSEGIITIATANKTENLDLALLRPGRLDFKVDFSCPDIENRRKIISRILEGSYESIEEIVLKSKGCSGAVVVQMAIEKAVTKYWTKERLK